MLNGTGIFITKVDHHTQRYRTVGDWYYDDRGNLFIVVSKMSDLRYELLVAFHELIEASLCHIAGIKEIDVTSFDIEFENNRIKGNTDEPGDDLRAPYHEQHVFATKLEKKFAKKLLVDWEKYDEEVNSL